MLPPILTVGPRPSSQRRSLRPWVCAALFALAQGLLTAPVHATPPSSSATLAQRMEGAPGHSVPLGVWTSRPGESQDDFMRRLAVPLRTYTDRTGFEACGVIQHEVTGERMRVYVSTNQSQMGCVFTVPDDSSFAPATRSVSIHTHPGGHSITPNVADAALFSGFLPGMGRYDLHSNRFSNQDYAQGAGYVVIPGAEVFGHPRLLYQDHRAGVERDLGRLPKLTLADVPPDAPQSISPTTSRLAQVESPSPATVIGSSPSLALRPR